MGNIYNSIVMATYNGEKYIREQIDSILVNMKENDELILSDDGSTDKTIKIIKEYQKKDKRITLIKGPNNGVKQNFANAIKCAQGKYIFLSDQDDVWEPNKLELINNLFEENDYSVIVHDALIVDSNLKSSGETFFQFRKSGVGKFKNIYKNTYIGCCMAFKKSLVNKILPIPNNIEMHDQWIGILGERYGKNFFFSRCLIKYRRHNNNVSNMKHYPLTKMIRNRSILLLELHREKRRNR